MKSTIIATVAALLLLASAPARAYDPAPVPGRHGMVVSAQALASRVGLEILEQGGNAGGTVGSERSPFGIELGVRYPAVDVDALLTIAKDAG